MDILPWLIVSKLKRWVWFFPLKLWKGPNNASKTVNYWEVYHIFSVGLPYPRYWSFYIFVYLSVRTHNGLSIDCWIPISCSGNFWFRIPLDGVGVEKIIIYYWHQNMMWSMVAGKRVMLAELRIPWGYRYARQIITRNYWLNLRPNVQHCIIWKMVPIRTICNK